MSEHKPITDKELQEIFDRCERNPFPSDLETDYLYFEKVKEDNQRLVAEVKRLKELLQKVTEENKSLNQELEALLGGIERR